MAKTPTGKADKENKPPPPQENDKEEEEKLTPFERMERLTRAVIHVPKEEAVKRKARKA
jgi:hypothetical protein